MDFSELLKGLFGAGISGANYNQNIQDVEDFGAGAREEFNTLADDLQADSAFTPFSVTSGTGQVDFNGNADGTYSGTNMQLTPELQAMVAAQRAASGDQLGQANQNTFDMTQGMLSQMGFGGPARSEQDIFNMLNQVQQPEQERERLALEERLFNQGRGGVRTAQFGGTPEELAIAKAREESRAGMSVDAFNLAREDDERRFNQFSNMFGANMQDRELSGNMSSDLFKNSFMAGDDLRRTGTFGLDAATVDRENRMQGSRLASGLRESGLEADLNTQEMALTARAKRNSDMVQLLLGGKDPETGADVGGLWDGFGDLTGWW